MIKKRLRKYVVLVIVAILLFVGLRLFFNSREVISYEAPRPLVDIVRPKQRLIENSLILNGYIEAEAMIPVVPFVNGTIVEYFARPGEFVEKDEVLARIVSKPFELQASQARAAYLGYENAYKRVSSLWEARAVTRQEYESVLAQRDAAKAQYDLAKLQLSYADVKAPVAGTVLTAPQSVGSIGNTGQPVAVLASMDDLVVRLRVPERHFDLFSNYEDQLKVFVMRESGIASANVLEAAADIDTVSPYVDALSKTFEVKLRLLEFLNEFRPGMFVKVRLVYQSCDDLFVLPQTAKKADGTLFLYDDASKSVSWVSFVSQMSSEDFFSVPFEYEDCFFVVKGQHSLLDGQLVNVRVVE